MVRAKGSQVPYTVPGPLTVVSESGFIPGYTLLQLGPVRRVYCGCISFTARGGPLLYDLPMISAIAICVFCLFFRCVCSPQLEILVAIPQMMQKGSSFSVRRYNRCLISSNNADLEGEVSPLERTPSQRHM